MARPVSSSGQSWTRVGPERDASPGCPVPDPRRSRTPIHHRLRRRSLARRLRSCVPRAGRPGLLPFGESREPVHRRGGGCVGRSARGRSVAASRRAVRWVLHWPPRRSGRVRPPSGSTIGRGGSGDHRDLSAFAARGLPYDVRDRPTPCRDSGEARPPRPGCTVRTARNRADRDRTGRGLTAVGAPIRRSAPGAGKAYAGPEHLPPDPRLQSPAVLVLQRFDACYVRAISVCSRSGMSVSPFTCFRNSGGRLPRGRSVAASRIPVRWVRHAPPFPGVLRYFPRPGSKIGAGRGGHHRGLYPSANREKPDGVRVLPTSGLNLVVGRSRGDAAPQQSETASCVHRAASAFGGVQPPGAGDPLQLV